MRLLRALRETARSGLTLERARLEPLVALRGALGVAVVVFLTLWLESPGFAASSAFGAFAAGMATFQHSWRPRAVLALVAGGGLALSTFLGYLAASHDALFVLLLAAWTFLAGLAWAVGPTSGVVASLTVGIMLVTVTIPTSVLGALSHAGVIAFGALVQAVLILLFPIRRWGAQRDALADAFAGVADYARRLRHDPAAPFDPEPLMTARSAAAVSPRQARRRPAELHGSRALAERIRPVLASLADPAVGAAAEGPERDRARELLAAAAAVLDAAAHSIRSGEPARVDPATVEALRAKEAGVPTGAAKRSAARLVALLGEALETAGDGSGAPAVSFATGNGAETGAAPLLRPSLRALVPVAARSVRRAFRWDSPVLRHALRVSAVTSLGYVLGTALHLGHSYWAPMCSVMVMRPDFHQTYARVVARFTGTVAGVVVATGVVQLVRPGAYFSAVLAVVFVGLMYLSMRTGYMLTQACVAAYVVFLLGMGGSEWQQTVPDRVLLTLLGGALAMVSYLAFPAWETPRLLDRLADWLAADLRYAAAVLGRYASPAGVLGAGLGSTAVGTSPSQAAPEDVREALLADRGARAAWEQALARAKLEPVRHPGLTRTAADDANDAVAALGRSAMVLEAHLPGPDARPLPAADRFAAALLAAADRAATDIREGRAPHWEEPEAALDAWPPATGPHEHFVRRGAEQILEALEDITDTVATFPLDPEA
ncbi:FUSC family protein, partial [Streptomyces pathocidini]|uniref:FUSC family protein n=1 Tax=Streptomyces pathocidini TaxID=1650571 RepID=UPI0006E3F505